MCWRCRCRSSASRTSGTDSRIGRGRFAGGARAQSDDAAVAAKLGVSVTIWHQSGKGGQETVQQAYPAAGQPQHKVTEFIDDMAAAYAWADVVVCRSGALTVSEIAAAGLPALFVPFQHKDRQQY